MAQLSSGDLVVGSFDGSFKVFNLQGACIRELQQPQTSDSILNNKCNAFAVSQLGDGRVIACNFMSLRIWELSSGQCSTWYIPGAAIITSMAVMPGGRHVALATKQVDYATHGCALDIWDVHTRTVLRRLDTKSPPLLQHLNTALVRKSHSENRSRNNFSCVTPLADGRVVFSLASDIKPSCGVFTVPSTGHTGTLSTGFLGVWDPAKNECKQLAGPSCDAECCPRCECCPEKVLCPPQNGQPRQGHPLYMGVVQLADGRVVSCSDEGVRVWL